MGTLTGDRSCRGPFPAQPRPVTAGRPGKADEADGSPVPAAVVRIRLLGRFRTLLAYRPAQALACFRDALELWHGEPLAEDTYAEWAQPDHRLPLALLDAFRDRLAREAA